jgi:hypothetical protein
MRKVSADPWNSWKKFIAAKMEQNSFLVLKKKG